VAATPTDTEARERLRVLLDRRLEIEHAVLVAPEAINRASEAVLLSRRKVEQLRAASHS